MATPFWDLPAAVREIGRCAKAGDRALWTEPDELRPLSRAGREQAAGIAKRLAGARVAIQGFGAVGKHAARFLAERILPLLIVTPRERVEEITVNLQGPLAIGADSVEGAASVGNVFHAAGRRLDVLLKVDCGYHRIGVAPERVPSAVSALVSK